MAIIDSKLELCDAQSLASTTTSGTHVGNIIDLGATGKDGWGSSLVESPGEGGSVFLNINVTTGLSAHTATIQLATDSALASSAMASATVIGSVLLPASTAAGQRRSFTVPSGGLLRYVQIRVVAGNNSLTGAIDAWLSNCPADSELSTTETNNLK